MSFDEKFKIAKKALEVIVSSAPDISDLQEARDKIMEEIKNCSVCEVGENATDFYLYCFNHHLMLFEIELEMNKRIGHYYSTELVRIASDALVLIEEEGNQNE